MLSAFDYDRDQHMALDTYDNAVPYCAAQRYSAVAMAVLAYEIANAPESISREGYYEPTGKID